MAHTKNIPNITLVKIPSEKKLAKEALLLFKVLKKRKLKIVFSESCTAGKAAATFCEIPNTSQIFCGSFVVYREKTKLEWLNIKKIELNKYTHVSKEVSLALAKKALMHTSEANLSVGITGHFGPKCSKLLDGIFHIAIVIKNSREKLCVVQSFKINDNALLKKISYQKIRAQRQIAASHSLFLMVRSLLSQ